MSKARWQVKSTKDPFGGLTADQQRLIMLDFEGGHSNKEIAPLIGLKNETTVSHWRKRDWYEPAYNAYAAKMIKGKYKSQALRTLVGLLKAKSEMVQLQSATTILKMAGMFSENDTPELIKAKVRKANADARVAEARAKALEDNGADVEVLIDKMLTTIERKDSEENAN